jgi:serine protease Do
MVSLSNGEKVPGAILGRVGETMDLALVRIKTKDPLPYLPLGDSTKVRVGQRVLAIGNPFGFERTLTQGIISRIDTERNRLQIDAALNPGNSGGPLVDTQGYLIGINQSIYNPEGAHTNIGIGFAVPVNAAKTFMARLSDEPALPPAIAEYSRDSIVRYKISGIGKGLF